MIKKKLSIQAVLAMLLSAILFTMPIGALFMNRTMSTPAHAEELPENEIVVEFDTDNKSENKDSGSNEQGKELMNESTSENNNTDNGSTETSDSGESGDEKEDEPKEPENLKCTCDSHCSGKYSYDANCEACSADYTKCEYVNPNVAITINAPQGWYSDSVKVTVGVKDVKNSGNFEIAKVEAKIGQSGSWQEITEEMYIEITENCTVYVQATDQNGIIYSKNKAIKCFDTTKPTFNAAVNDGLLTVETYDGQSGVAAVYVNSYEYTELTNGTLNIRLKKFDASYEYFSIRVMDNVGNMSDVYKVKNPYYDDDPSDDDDKGKSDLPTSVVPNPPSNATATVTDHTKTDVNGNTTYSSKQEAEKRASMAEEEAAEKDKDSKKDEKTDSENEYEGGKEFYTIQTKNEKVFYLVIDRDKDNNETVHFLTAINENDLLNVTENNSENLPMNSAAIESAIPTGDALDNNIEESDTTVTLPEEETPTEEEETEVEAVEEPAKQNTLGAYILMGIIAAGAIGAWYYLKIVKGKKEDFVDEEDEEDEDEDPVYESDDEEEKDVDDFFKMDDELDDVTDITDDEE